MKTFSLQAGGCEKVQLTLIFNCLVCGQKQMSTISDLLLSSFNLIKLNIFQIAKQKDSNLIENILVTVETAAFVN